MLFDNMKRHVYQVAYFVKFGGIRSDELSSLVRKHLDIGEFEPMLIPEQPGMPPEFPRLQISTPKGFRLTVSKVRIDFFIDLPLGIEEEETRAFMDNCIKLSSLLENNGYIFSRLGMICTMFEKMDNAADSILNSLTRLNPSDASDASLTITKKTQINEYECNSVYSYSNGGISTGDVGLVAMRDVNTSPALDINITGADANKFISTALNEIQPSSLNIIGK